jgi:hypothetical protein
MTRTKKPQSHPELDAAYVFKTVYASYGSGDQFLDWAKQRFWRGDKWALAYALYACALHHPDRPLPEWVTRAVVDAFYKLIISLEYSSWDQVFGPPHLKGAHVDQKRLEFEKRFALWVMVTKLREDGMSCDDAFHLAAKKFHRDEATVSKYYYDAAKLVRRDPTKKFLEQQFDFLKQLEKMAAGMRLHLPPTNFAK